MRALLECKCPVCHEGKVFPNGAYDLANFHRMPGHCPVCNKSFLPEPGFYFGAMYVSYAFTVAVTVTVWVALAVLFDPPESVTISAMIGAVVLFMPLSFRYSRMLWLYWFG